AAGTGAGGLVVITATGALLVDGQGGSGTQIAGSATGVQSGAGGAVTVNADSLTIDGGGQIASTAAGLGKGRDVAVTIAGDVSLSGAATDGTASAITASTTACSVGGAGQVTLSAGGVLSL